MFTYFYLLENCDGHLAGLIEAKPEVLGKIYSYRKDVPFYVLQFCIHANFLSVQSLRRYEFFKKYCLFTYLSLLENREGHLAGLIEAKPEVLGKIYPHRKDVPFYVLQFCIYANFLSVQSLGAMNFLKNNVCSLFFLSTKIVTAALRALWRLNQKS